MKGGKYCYVHSFGKFSYVPWYKNPTIHLIFAIIGLALTVWSVTTGATKVGQDEAQESLDRIEDDVNRVDDHVGYLENRHIFRPLVLELRQDIEHRSQFVYAKYRDVQPKVVIYYLTNDTSRKLVAEQMIGICKTAGFPSRIIDTMMTSKTEPLLITFDSKNHSLAKEFIKAWGPLLRNKEVPGEFHSGYDQGELHLHLIGNFQFESDGSVLVR